MLFPSRLTQITTLVLLAGAGSLWATACGGDSPPNSPSPAVGSSGSGGGGGSETGSGGGAAAGGSAGSGGGVPWGIDARPANPTCVAHPRPAGSISITTENPFPNLNLTKPLSMRQLPGDSSRWYAALRDGQVVMWDATDPTVFSATTVLDITSQVESNYEMGLLSIVFSPTFASDGALFVSYNTPSQHSRLSRFDSTNGGLSFGNEQILLELKQPYSNHNGGDLQFAADGTLLMSLGDGGDKSTAQDTTSLLGSIIRIDPFKDDGLSPTSELITRNYGIPSNNPFAGGTNPMPEIYAYGLRNPWRFTIDPLSGDIWTGDVGQGDWEEVDLILPGANYGWPHKEGAHCYDSNPCDNAAWTDPIVEYNHNEGLSVIGGQVYRGSAIPELYGHYIFSEWSTGVVWGVFNDETTGEPKRVQLADLNNFGIFHWAQANDGEIYTTVGQSNASIRRLVAAQPSNAPAFPQQLSETGCSDPQDTTQPASGMIPYGVRVKLWSDDVTKNRWLAIPDGTTVDIESNGHWTLPLGSVLTKEFIVDGARAETRLLMRHEDGAWAGYSYKWNEAGTDAVLVPNGSTYNTGSRTWEIPSSAQCMQCHTTVAGQTLGMETAQQNRAHDYGGGGLHNQITTLDHIGLFTAGPGAPANLPALPELGGDAPAKDQARAYLSVNCAHCHVPGGPSQGNLDLHWKTADAAMNVCNEAPQHGNLGVSGAMLVAPGNPAASVLSLRMHTLAAERMPRIGSKRVDTDATAVVDDWITNLQSCP